MQVFNEIQIEIKRVVIFNNNLKGIKEICFYRATMYLCDIKDISQYSYYDSGERKACLLITRQDNTFFKAVDDYKSVRDEWVKWNKDQITKEMEKYNDSDGHENN